ncbi:hypothetical protein HBH56_043170 [Parastagonospora nodorum]|uniref:Uncharacterized protein n=1 Tax=Phaeosphaeria nodorum (strain SN15 / ATCC MYA-4574 / FGSC 10173) TaxID=321614 RepID=A0A7U2HV02_PHANO|nr:hypothetical protein HBH56_043170 [Parastagonospora nodorum]QRC92865.1 hypothetical protein JI435_428630 [Parastagonospora nodorum SN15]KAH3933088.1 hypothetical protein HBH54_070920 [Parastagonospora nodorum]KAH3973190.1 hypothetical protein HBH52_143080 [Parastagonospora nodorum]KAH3981005.1 hypothetical protein HBH51_049010 [Parastagonospora nodorum]
MRFSILTLTSAVLSIARLSSGLSADPVFPLAICQDINDCERSCNNFPPDACGSVQECIDTCRVCLSPAPEFDFDRTTCDCNTGRCCNPGDGC